MSKSRAKRKRKQRTRAAGTTARTGGSGAKAREGRDAAKTRAGAHGAKARGGASGAKTRGGAVAATGGAKRHDGAGGAKADGVGATGDVARPTPIWAPFPLTEIGMGVGIVIFGAGYLTASSWLVSIGALVLAVVVGELCVREHFAGFRSHALLLAALVVVAVQSLLFVVDDAFRSPVALVADLAIGGALAWWLRARFRVARERHTT